MNDAQRKSAAYQGYFWDSCHNGTADTSESIIETQTGLLVLSSVFRVFMSGCGKTPSNRRMLSDKKSLRSNGRAIWPDKQALPAVRSTATITASTIFSHT